MILHVVPAISNEASGPSYSVVRLCESLIEHGETLALAVLDWDRSGSDRQFVRCFPLGFGPRRLGRSPAMARWIIAQAASGSTEIIHNHGLWMMPNVYAGWARGRARSRLIVSPRGTVSALALAHHAARKRVLWMLAQAQTMKRADCFHATAQSEHEDVRRLGLRQPVCIVPNGIDLPALVQTTGSGRRQLLYLGRIHKKKGIDNLLRAWRAVQDKAPDWEVVVAGPDDGGCLGQMQSLAASLGAARVHFPGPIYGDAKLAAYRAASLFVLPTHSENFAMTVAEALAAGTPAIVTKGAPWRGLEREAAGWWIEIGVDPLVACLERALALPDATLAQMGRNGRAWMERDFSWRSIAIQMSAVYRWLSNAAERPECVRMD